ncbi:MAG: STAS domain-containing protein, partial [Paracoccaceae bacterium]
EFITSAGLRALLMADRQIKSGGGKFIVSGIDGVVKEVFRISKSDAVLNVADTAAEGGKQVSSAAAEAYPG